MELHARNVAIMAGATGDFIDLVVEKMVEERKVRVDRARELIEEYGGKREPTAKRR